eukprot:g4780.t1
MITTFYLYWNTNPQSNVKFEAKRHQYHYTTHTKKKTISIGISVQTTQVYVKRHEEARSAPNEKFWWQL